MIAEEKIEGIASINLDEFYSATDEDYRRRYYGIQEKTEC